MTPEGAGSAITRCDLRGSAARAGPVVVLLLLVLELGCGHDALAVRRALLAGDVLLAQGLAGRGGVRLARRNLGHRGDALAEGRALLTRDVLLALALAVLAIRLGLRVGAGARPRRSLRGGRLRHGGMAARLGVVAARTAGRRVAGGQARPDEQGQAAGGGGYEGCDSHLPLTTPGACEGQGLLRGVGRARVARGRGGRGRARGGLRGVGAGGLGMWRGPSGDDRVLGVRGARLGWRRSRRRALR